MAVLCISLFPVIIVDSDINRLQLAVLGPKFRGLLIVITFNGIELKTTEIFEKLSRVKKRDTDDIFVVTKHCLFLRLVLIYKPLPQIPQILYEI